MSDPHEFDLSDPFDAELQRAARAYHEPPAVPADAMWAAIQARRASATPMTPDLVRRDVVVRRTPGGRVGGWGRAARRWTPIAVAAAALLAVGVGLGRYSAAPNGPTVAAAVAATGAPSGRSASEHSASERSASGHPEAVVAARAAGTSRVADAGSRVHPGTDAPARRSLVTHRDGRRPAVVAGVGATADPPDAASAPLRAAADQHLADTEALLTAFDAAGSGASGPPVAAAPDSAWARDLLTTTRLLLDSPAGRDPARRSLLESLELVLVQIARLPHADTPTERALIARAIRHGDLMARLRAAVPSGPGRARAVQGT